MCIVFKPRIIHEYAFSPCDDLNDVSSLTKEAIMQFCSVLKREITMHTPDSPHYKYVYFAFGKEDMDEFFLSNSCSFLDFGNEVMLIRQLSPSTAAVIERAYADDVVTNALRVARSSLEARMVMAPF